MSLSEVQEKWNIPTRAWSLFETSLHTRLCATAKFEMKNYKKNRVYTSFFRNILAAFRNRRKICLFAKIDTNRILEQRTTKSAPPRLSFNLFLLIISIEALPVLFF